MYPNFKLKSFFVAAKSKTCA